MSHTTSPLGEGRGEVYFYNMKKQYIKPTAQSLTFAGLQLLDTTLTVSGDFSGDPNAAKRHTPNTKPNTVLAPDEEKLSETAQNVALPRFSVWD